MPSGFVDDPKGDVADEEVNDGGFGDDILAADADGIDVLLLNVGQHHAAAVIDDPAAVSMSKASAVYRSRFSTCARNASWQSSARVI